MAKLGLKILIVDDNPDARTIVGHTLRSKGYEILEATSGKEVLSRAKSEWPSLIILDLMLPDMPGTEVFQALRADPITKVIPILLVTARPDIVSKIPVFQEAKDRTVDKAAHVNDLVQTVHEMLRGPKLNA